MSTNPIERKVISIASSEVEVLALKLEVATIHGNKPRVLMGPAGVARESSSGGGQEASDQQVRGGKMHVNLSRKI